MSRKRKGTTEPEPMPTLPSSCGSVASCSRCGKPREIGDSCLACYLRISQQMAATVKDEPHLVTHWKQPG